MGWVGAGHDLMAQPTYKRYGFMTIVDNEKLEERTGF
jgi:hypothetical protein